MNQSKFVADTAVVDTKQAPQKIVGTLDAWPLEEIIDSLSSTSKSGLIKIEGSQIWFHHGGIYLVQTPNSEKLSEVLFNAEVGTLSEIDDRFYSPEEHGYVIDQLLAEYPGAESQLKLVMNEYNLAGLLQLLVPSESEFTIIPEKLHRLGFTLASDAPAFVQQAKKRLQVWKSIATAVPSTETVFVLKTVFPDGEARRSFSTDEWKYLSRLDGVNTVENLIHETGDAAFSVATSLYRLMLEDIIEEKKSQES